MSPRATLAGTSVSVILGQIMPWRQILPTHSNVQQGFFLPYFHYTSWITCGSVPCHGHLRLRLTAAPVGTWLVSCLREERNINSKLPFRSDYSYFIGQSTSYSQSCCQPGRSGGYSSASCRPCRCACSISL